MPAIVQIPRVVQDARDEFADLFANEPQRQHFAEYLTGLMVEHNKTVSGISSEFAETTDQSCLNRFLTEVDWDVEELNERRLQLHQDDADTRYYDQGVIAIDDVMIDHDGKLIEDVGWFWDHAEDRHKIAHDYLIANYVCRNGKHYPLEFHRFKKREQCEATRACGRFTYEAAVTNGIDSVSESASEIDDSPAFILKLDYNILQDDGKNMKYSESDYGITQTPAWVVGTGFVTDANNGTSSVSQDEFKVYQVEVDTAFKYMGFSLQSEYVARWLYYDPLNPADILDLGRNTVFAHGFYVQSGYFILPEHGVEIGARGSVVWSEGVSLRHWLSRRVRWFL